MKKATHKKKTHAKAHNNLKKVLFIGGILLAVAIIFKLNVQSDMPAPKVEPDKKTQKLSEVVIPFAKQQELQLLSGQSATECHGRSKCFVVTYQSNQPLESLIEPFMTFIKDKGYNVKGYHYTTSADCIGYRYNQQKKTCDTRIIKNPINEGSPIWVFSGRNENHDEVYGTISDKTYMNETKTAELPVTAGSTVLQITFTTK